MLKSLFTVMMAFSLLIVQANASTHNGLKAAFDELNFALNVEWDQKNQDFYIAQKKKFSAAIRKLQAKGLTNDQLIDFIKTEVKDAKAARDIETALNMIAINKMSSEEASKYMVDTMKRVYSNGASWSGNAATTVLVAVVLVAVIVAAATGNLTFAAYGPYCHDTYVCDSYCEYDYWYGYTCYDDCYWTCY